MRGSDFLAGGWLAGMVLSASALAAQPAPLLAGLAAWSDDRPAAAVADWLPLAEAGDARAQFYLGYAYLRGEGVARDESRAFHWYGRAARNGIADAQYQLGLMYELGIGVLPDQAEADYWYGRAVGQGFCPGELSAGGALGD